MVILLRYSLFNSSLLGKYQSEYPPSTKSLHNLAAIPNVVHPATISIVFWFPVPRSVPSAPGIDVPTQPHGEFVEISATVATNPCSLPASYPGSPGCNIYAITPPKADSPIVYVPGGIGAIVVVVVVVVGVIVVVVVVVLLLVVVVVVGAIVVVVVVVVDVLLVVVVVLLVEEDVVVVVGVMEQEATN